MLLIPEQVKYLRESITSLKKELEDSTYLENREVTVVEESCYRIKVIDIFSDDQFLGKKKRLVEYQNLLYTSEYIKKVNTDEIGIGTKFKVKFDGEETEEEFILVDSIIGTNLSSEAVTVTSPFGKSILGKKEGNVFSYMPRPDSMVSGTITEIKKKNSDYTSFIKNISSSHRMSRFATRELKALKEQMKTTENAKKEYEKRMEISRSQLELLQNEKERLSRLTPKDIKEKSIINHRISIIEKLIATRKVADLPTDDSIGVGTSFSVMFFTNQNVITKRVEMINQAVGDELADEYVERISPFGSQVYGLKEQEEFVMFIDGSLTLTGIVFDIDNRLERTQTTSPLLYQKQKKMFM